MPFTFSHPALVIPFIYRRNNWFSATGLIVGSMIPDFEGFISFGNHRWHSHTWAGMFWLDFPVALAVAILFHWLIRNPLIEHAPEWIRIRCYDLKDFNWWQHFRKRWPVVIISTLAGIASHLIWDDFTHTDHNYNELYSTITGHETHTWQWYPPLQYGSSLLGLVIVLWTVKTLPVQKDVPPLSGGFHFWWFVIIMVIATNGINLLFLHPPYLASKMVKASGLGFCIGIFAASLRDRWLRYRYHMDN